MKNSLGVNARWVHERKRSRLAADSMRWDKYYKWVSEYLEECRADVAKKEERLVTKHDK